MRSRPYTRGRWNASRSWTARATTRKGASWTVTSYANPSKGVPPRQDSAVDPVQRYLDGVVLHGTPEKLIDQLQQLNEEMFLDYLLCAPLSHSSFILFTDRILPNLS